MSCTHWNRLAQTDCKAIICKLLPICNYSLCGLEHDCLETGHLSPGNLFNRLLIKSSHSEVEGVACSNYMQSIAECERIQCPYQATPVFFFLFHKKVGVLFLLYCYRAVRSPQLSHSATDVNILLITLWVQLEV